MSKDNTKGKGKEDHSPKETFSVDTHLFRELGELLVGRDSTALVELIKNAYDADARTISVYSQGLDERGAGSIVITDDGLGMTADQFRRGFLRIASRLKEEGDRRSPRFKRRFTGAKGIGRLAAHKLACHLHVESVATDPLTREPIERIDADIDWDMVESALTIDSTPVGSIKVNTHPIGAAPTVGTTITLTRLRKKWTARDVVRFVAEAQQTVAPALLTDVLSDTVVSESMRENLLFSKPTYQSPRKSPSVVDPGWQLELAGDFDVGERYWLTLAEQASWILDIDVNKTRASYAIVPTVKKLRRQPDVSPFESEIPFGENEDAPAFQARILLREGSVGGGQPAAARTWIQETHGIRVYMEGFRVLPYGESGDDWLRIDRSYADRSRAVDGLSAALFGADKNDENVGLTIIPNRQYFGAIFLTSVGAGNLNMLVNREGFIPDSAFVRLQELVIAGIGLATRVRAAASAADREARRNKRSTVAADEPTTSTQNIVEVIGQTIDFVHEARKALAAGDNVAAKGAIDSLESAIASAAESSKDIADEQAMLRVLASLGAQTAGFVHEINGLLALSGALERALKAIRAEFSAAESRKFGARLGKVAAQISDLRLALERQASYLTEIVGPDRRRRRSRQDVRARFDSALGLLRQYIDKHNIVVENQIPADIRTPPMFGAELVAIFTNLLTNAVKAVGEKGAIVASGRIGKDDAVVLRVENTGQRVKLDSAETWFLPFTSTTNQANSMLGVGMGLGLPITRRILEEYGATIAFAAPSARYATAIEIRFGGSVQ